MDPDAAHITELIAKAPWREAVTYRDTWPHEYVVIQKDAQQELLAAFRQRILQGEGVECHFFHQTRPYLFLGDHKYWVMDEVEGIDPETYDSVLNRALLYRDRRDFVIQRGDTGTRGEDAIAETEEGIEQVEVRKLWAHEAHNFTPWLAKNLDLLGDELGMKLESMRQEQQIGSFSLDILARETNEDVTVAIENQLEWTDHGHLGQLLTYAAGCDARIAIWVATEFQYEHAEALHRLNQWVGTNIRFYGIKVEAIKRTEGSEVEPRLRKVVYPGGWHKDLTLPTPPPPPPEIQQYRAFFEPLIANLLGSGMSFANSYNQAWDYHDRFFPSGFDKDIGYTASLGGGFAWVGVHIRTWDSVDLNNKMFDELRDDQKGFESSIDAQAEWNWDRFDRYSFSTIDIRKEGSIDDPPDKLEETRQWMLDLLPKFKEIFEPRVERLLGKLRQ